MQQCDRNQVRVITFLPDERSVLFLRGEHGLRFPCLEIPRYERYAEALTTQMKRECGCSVVCLFRLDIAGKREQGKSKWYQVVECWRQQNRLPDKTVWRAISLVSPECFEDAHEHSAMRRCLAEYEVRQLFPRPEPFANPGWFRQLQMWVEMKIRPVQLRLTGKFSQVNGTASFSLIRFETTGEAVWFKAVGEENRHECAITRTLARFFPRHISPVLAAHSQWNGWLSREVSGANLGDSHSVEHWKSSAETLALLQIESIGTEAVLRESGARNLSATALRRLLSPFMSQIRELMQRQKTATPPRLSPFELRWLQKQINHALVCFERIELPNTLGHCDLNPANIIVRPDGCTFLDWAEAYVGPAFFSFQYLLEHFRRTMGGSPRDEVELAASYLRPWKALCADAKIRLAMQLVPLLAVFAYAAGSNFWRNQNHLQAEATGGYLRALTRRMYREALQLFRVEGKCQS